MSTGGGSSHHSSAGGSHGGSSGGSSGGKITPDLEAKWKDIPDKYLMVIAHFLSGHINDTDAFDKYNGPVMKSSIKSVYWIFLIQYAVLAVLGIFMNVAIIAYIMYHKLYKDVTHSFIINLALCHFVQCAVVLPITLMVMMIQNWIFGQFLCFFLPMLQDIPLHVAMISHILIAWDRMRWLGDPLRGRLPAFVCCCATWLTGMVIALPYPIYTMYVEIGDYVPRLNGIGLCVVNLMDDMHEYMRGLFVIMYCGPTILLAYLYIRTSQELRPPDGPFAQMMFEHRADVRNRQRNSSTSSVERAPGRTTAPITTDNTTSSKSYDLYNAEMDVCREKRKQRNLGSMAATQVLCLCPLMILRLARMVMVETYENTRHFDFTYLMFVWIAFLPTVIFPCIYASQILPRTEKERLRGYFRLSTKRLKKSRQDSQEESIEKDDNTTTTQTTTVIQNGGSGIHGSDPKQKQHHRSTSSSIAMRDTINSQGAIKINVIGDGTKKTSSAAASRCNGLGGGTHSKMASNHKVMNGLRPAAGSRKAKNSIDSINNSCSNITASTYCNISSMNDAGSGYDGETSSIVSGMTGTTDKDVYFEKKWESVNGAPHLLRHKDASFSDCGSFTRMDSSSTLERDLEIIDLLERERSMDIQDMMEREKRGECMRLMSGSGSERRRLPDLEKICKSPKLKIDPYTYEKVVPGVPSHPTTPQQTPVDDGIIVNKNVVNVGGGDSSEVGAGDFFNEEYPPPPSAAASTTSSYYHHHSRRLSRRSSHHSNHSNRSKRDSFNSLNGDLIAGTFGELDPTQPLSKMSVIESRMRRSSGRTSSISSSGRSSLKSRDYQPQHSHPELDFRENIFAELTEKERLRGYFRLSTKRLKKSRQDSQEESIEKDDNTTTTQTTTVIQNGGSGIHGSDPKQKQHHRSTSSSIAMRDTINSQGAIKINVIGDGTKKTSSAAASRCNGLGGGTHSKMASNHKVMNGLRPAAGSRKAKNSIDSINNSCSNITASTYCNISSMNDAGSGYDGETSSIVSGMTGTTDKDVYFEKKWESVNGAPHLLRHKDASFSDCGSFTRMDSSSTLERDLEIIDLLERERSMDIQDMMEREKRGECMRLMSGSGSERRRLPDLEKICKSPKLKIDPYTYEKVVPGVPSHPTTPQQTPVDDGIIVNKNVVNVGGGDSSEVGAGDFFNEEYPPPPSAAASTTSSYYHHHSRRLSRRSSHHSNHSNRSKRDSFNSLNGDLIAGTFGELDPTQPLSKMSVIESRMRRSSGRTSSISSSGRSSLKSRDYQPQHSHPELDFRENIFAEL